jgi:hypothetical protein
MRGLPRSTQVSKAHRAVTYSDIALIIFCATSTSALFLFVATIGHLAPINDHVFLGTLFDGKVFAGYVDRALGRFTPLASMEYTLVSRLLWPSATLFYVLHAAKMALTAGVLLWALRAAGAGAWLSFAAWCATFFSTDFGYSAVILQAGELNELLLTEVFVVVVLLRESGRLPKTRGGLLIVAAGSIALIATFLYKEVAFAMAIAFGAAEWLRYRLSGRPAPRYAVGLLIAGMAYLVWYAAWHGVRLNGSYAQSHAISLWDMVWGYAANDPVIVFVSLPIVIVRVGLLASRRAMPTVFDSFLLAGFAYVAAFIGLRLYSAYYFLPAYGFVLCGVAGLLANSRSRIVVVTACVVFAINAAPVELSDIVGARNIAQNYSPFVDSLSRWIWANPTADGASRRLVLVGAQPAQEVEIFGSMKRFLAYAGLPDSSYQLVPDRSAEPGDVLVYNPFQQSVAWPPVATPSDASITRSGATHTFPRWPAWRWLAECYGSVDWCHEKVTGNSPYTGYAAFVRTREPIIGGSPIPVVIPRYRIGPLALPERMRAGSRLLVDVPVQNVGGEAWPSDGSNGPGNFVHMSYVWLDAAGHVAMEGLRSATPETIRAGDTFVVPMTIVAPPALGQYTLVISPVQENVKWFYQEDPQAPGASKHVEVFKSIFARIVGRIFG